MALRRGHADEWGIAIVTLVYLERLLAYAELDVAPCNWKRMVLSKMKGPFYCLPRPLKC
uniref:Uncharacterized protein n=1 Tax=Glossina morsitans morsitans TaxID=37546 RepID=A0A1B0FM83_GLOMM